MAKDLSNDEATETVPQKKMRHSTRSAVQSVRSSNAPRARGRPTVYSKELARRICNELVLGKSLRLICNVADMPDITTVLAWALNRDHDFYQQYKDARQMQAELRVDELDDLAKSALNCIKDGPNGPSVDAGAVAAIKLLIDLRKWSASKMLPKVYGSREEEAQPQRFIPLSELREKLKSDPGDESDD